MRKAQTQPINQPTESSEPLESSTIPSASEILQAKARYEELMTTGKQRLLDVIDNALFQLSELGLNYRVMSEEEFQACVSRSRTKASPIPPYDPDKHCKICKMAGHNGRLHRTRKGPFSMEELGAMDLLPFEQPTQQHDVDEGADVDGMGRVE